MLVAGGLPAFVLAGIAALGSVASPATQRGIGDGAPPGLALSGRVLDPDGAPVSPLTVRAVEQGAWVSAEFFHDAWYDRDVGPRAVTDPDGRFALSGLAPGRYELVVAFPGREPQRIGPGLFPAGARDVVAVAPVRRVAVRVLDHLGRVRELARLGVPLRERRAGEPAFFSRVVPERAGSHRHDDRPRPVDALALVAGDAAIVVAEAGDEVLLAYAAPEVPLVERRLVMPAQPWLVREDLVLPPPVEPAVLRLSATSSDRKPLGPCALELLAPCGADVAALPATRHGNVRLPVAPGTYRVRLTPTHWLLCWSGDPDELLPPYAPVEADVVLESGRETALALVVRRTARVRVTLALAPRGDPSEVHAALQSNDRESLRRELGGAVLELRGENGSVVHPEFSVHVPESDVGLDHRHPVPWIAPGRECVSITALAPGAYHARVELDDGRAFEGEVVLEESRTATLQLLPAGRAR